MKTIIAYILAFFLGPSLAALTSIIVLPTSVLLIRHGIPQFPVLLAAGIINGIGSVWVGTIILDWFSLNPTIWLVLILGLGYIMNGVHRFNTKENTDIELGFLFGSVIGIIFSGLFFIWSFKINQLTIPFLITVGVIGFIAYTMTNTGNLSFWKMASKYPDEAYTFFTSENSWYVIDGINNSEPPPKYENWVGPFRLFIPSINSWIEIYGNSKRYIESQKTFKNYIDHRTY